jgi:hypothetical protein
LIKISHSRAGEHRAGGDARLADQSRRSLDLARRLEALAQDLGPAPTLECLQQAVKAAIQLQLSQEERWTDESFRGRLVRAG